MQRDDVEINGIKGEDMVTKGGNRTKGEMQEGMRQKETTSKEREIRYGERE